MVEIIILTEKKQIQIFTEELGKDVEGKDVKLELVQIPSGSFIMGAPESEKDSRSSERPQHEVRISSFLMGRYPITQAQWQAIANKTELKKDRDLNRDPSRFKEPYQGRDRWERPVEQVSWYDAVEFCHRLSKLTGRNYQLPSEAQWEYACRAVTNYQSSETSRGKFLVLAPELRIKEWNEKYCQPFHFGETITSDLANYRATSTYGDEPEGVYRRETTPVGMFPPNAFGLHDLHGNVWEWCEDTWHENYNNAPTDGRAWITERENIVVVRGSSWLYLPRFCRSACRYINLARAYYYAYVGFRVVCVVGRTT